MDFAREFYIKTWKCTTKARFFFRFITLRFFTSLFTKYFVLVQSKTRARRRAWLVRSDLQTLLIGPKISACPKNWEFVMKIEFINKVFSVSIWFQSTKDKKCKRKILWYFLCVSFVLNSGLRRNYQKFGFWSWTGKCCLSTYEVKRLRNIWRMIKNSPSWHSQAWHKMPFNFRTDSLLSK